MVTRVYFRIFVWILAASCSPAKRLLSLAAKGDMWLDVDPCAP